MIICRRVGYTEERNPDHVVTIFGNHGGMLNPTFHTCRELIPTVEEFVTMLYSVLHTAGKPEYISVDELSVLETLTVVLDGTGVKASYYSPPSDEEATLHDATNPHMPNGCAVCGVHLQPDGTKLFRCSRCKSVQYCSKEHQKKHWKLHKMMCTEA